MIRSSKRTGPCVAAVVGFVCAVAPTVAWADEPRADAETAPPAVTVSPTPAVPTPAPTLVSPTAPTSDGQGRDVPSEPSAHAFGTKPPRHDWFRIALGTRVGYVGTSGFDTFAETNTLPQFSLEATYAFFARPKFSVAAGLAWDVGGRSSDLRRLSASLTVHRLTVPIEGRYHVASWLYAFGRIAPGAAAFVTDVEDPSSPAPLSRAPWVFAADASVGASFLIGPHTAPERRNVRFWVTPEIGYAYTTSADVRAKPDRDEAEVLGTDARTNFGSLATSGVFWRATVAMTF